MRIIHNIIFYILFLLLAAIELYGQILPFHNYTMGDGLISNSIQSMCQDSLGYIWVGTAEGLSKFDSKEFHNYSKPEGLSSEKIDVVIADKHHPGQVWIGTNGGGVEKFVNGKFKHFGTKSSNALNVIDALYLDKNDILWCGTDSGLFKIENDSLSILNDTHKLGNIYSLTSDRDGNILIGCEKGLFMYFVNARKLSPVVYHKFTSQPISILYNNQRGSIWAATIDGYLFKINTRSGPKDCIYLNTSIHAITEDSKNHIWIATSDGIYKFREKNFPRTNLEKLTTENGLLENNISTVFFDRENILWVGTNVDGIQKLVHQNLIKFKIPKKYKSENWASIAADSNNHFWISLDKGLMETWQDKLKKWHYNFHLINKFNRALPAIFCSKSNVLYIAYNIGKIKIFKIENANPSSDKASNLKLSEQFDLSNRYKFADIYTIYCDKNNYLWCSALDLGVLVISPNKKRKVVKIYKQGDGLPDNSVRAIYEDSKGNIWFGGYAHGLSEFSYGKILSDLHLKLNYNPDYKVHYSILNGLPDNDIRSISEDDNGDLLIGTRYGGLAVLEGNKFKTITREEGLFSNAIWSITRTPGKDLWLGTQSGIQEISGELKPSLKLNNEIPKVPYYSICCSKNGVLCFVNNTDIYIYQPSFETGKILPPPIYLSHVLINGQEEKIKKNLALASFQNTITFEFIGIINRGENLTKYYYRLRSVDKDWNLLKNRNSITYASLSPGHYTFQVLAVDNNNIKSIHPAELTFTIHEPFYKQWWFMSIVLAIIILSIAAAARIRVARLLEIEKIRTRIAADLHDEIGSGLTRIAILSENVLRDEDIVKGASDNSSGKYTRNKSIERVGKISRALVDSMIDVIWSIDPKYDSLDDFIFNFRTYANEVCEAKNIKLLIETKNINNVKVNSQIKRSLQLVSKEALNNSLKYSGCTMIRYFLGVNNKEINLLIEDNGSGFNSEKVQYGHGIFNMEKHAKDLSGTFKFESISGQGVKITINFPYQR